MESLTSTSAIDQLTAVFQAGAKKTDKAAKATKKTEAEKGEGICARIIAVVKNVIATIVFYLTCTMVDLRTKVLMFKGEKTFHVLTSLKVTDKELHKEIKGAMVAACKTRWAEFDMKDEAAQKVVDDRLVVEAAALLREALKGGVVPVEYRFTNTEKGGLQLHMYAPAHMKADKLPKLAKPANKAHSEAVKAGAWKKDQEVKLSKKKEEAKAEKAKKTKGKEAKKKPATNTVKCHMKTVTLNFEGLPKVLDDKKSTAEIQDLVLRAQKRLEELKAARGSQEAPIDRDFADAQQLADRLTLQLRAAQERTKVNNQTVLAMRPQLERVRYEAEVVREIDDKLHSMGAFKFLTAAERLHLKNIYLSLVQAKFPPTLSVERTSEGKSAVCVFFVVPKKDAGDDALADAAVAAHMQQANFENLLLSQSDFYETTDGKRQFISLKFADDHHVMGTVETVAETEVDAMIGKDAPDGKLALHRATFVALMAELKELDPQACITFYPSSVKLKAFLSIRMSANPTIAREQYQAVLKKHLQGLPVGEDSIFEDVDGRDDFMPRDWKADEESEAPAHRGYFINLKGDGYEKVEVAVEE